MRIELNGKSYFVDFAHEGRVEAAAWPHEVVSNGATYCWVYEDTDNNRILHREGLRPSADGRAYCHIYDQFRKSVGRKISFTRALYNLGFSKEERKELWEGYFKAMPKDKKVS